MIRTRRLVTLQVAGALSLGISLAGTLAYRMTVSEDRRRLQRRLVVVEIVGLLAGVLIGQTLARRTVAPVGEELARRSRFTADVSHELRTPLTRLHTQAQLVARRLRQETPGTPVLVADDVDLMVAGTRQLGEVIEDLLSSAQLRRLNRLNRASMGIDLAALAEEVAAAEAARAKARGVTIEVGRQGTDDHVVRGVESALRRVISALLDNALGHTSRGGHIWMTVSGGPANTVELTVRDDGVGLDPRDAERLFTRGVGEGFGLGLALVRQVVNDHGGTISADGRPGAGAVFTARLPAAPTEVADPSP